MPLRWRLACGKWKKVGACCGHTCWNADYSPPAQGHTCSKSSPGLLARSGARCGLLARPETSRKHHADKQTLARPGPTMPPQRRIVLSVNGEKLTVQNSPSARLVDVIRNGGWQVCCFAAASSSGRRGSRSRALLGPAAPCRRLLLPQRLKSACCLPRCLSSLPRDCHTHTGPQGRLRRGRLRRVHRDC